MRFDIISVFPEFFSVLDLSLVGKARERGVLEVASHDLRGWTDDPHRTVDDTPAGGGAGMVMRADVWGKALDDVLGEHPEGAVLAIPTPAGEPLTQRRCEELATAEHIVIACGRYEGIDSRVAKEYEGRGVCVFQYSLGDYVLNGGEVAAVALVEAVGRLVPGMVGNPESLVEESHGAAGLLEYPVFTRPTEWRGQEIPAVLTSGNHGAVARWRRDRALELTSRRRPDMIAALDVATLDKHDRKKLAQLGYLYGPQSAHPSGPVVRRAQGSDVVELAELAARTFPDACPQNMADEDIQAFIRENLSESFFAHAVNDPGYLVIVLEHEGVLRGYTLSYLPQDDGVSGADRGAPVAHVVGESPRVGPLAELSKFYVDRCLRASGASAMLWQATLDELQRWAQRWPEPYVWLGTHIGNRRAQKAYVKLGFEYAGKRIFRVGEQDNVDRVYVRRIHVA